ncbi:MAG: hypothetical protein CVU39_26255 [Chloroflexi bacterium HGW-Chloroflexi-10]|nr:MAG: hypothetical protein CVU39_26255 [Chloroflexi bacterium HGW-Chloroflexi-10]
MVSFRDLVSGFKHLEIDPAKPVIVHASLSAVGDIRGGVDTALGALLACYTNLMMPSFTFKTMLIPEDGPQNNGLLYGSGKDTNRMAEFFTEGMPVDPLIGELAEALRNHAEAKRSTHPILSFCGIGVQDALASQSLEEPFEPIMCLTEQQGWVILLGVDHSVNTSLHVAEQHAGRRPFTRWALTPHGIVECPNFPGCSDGFDQVAPYLVGMTRQTQVGNAILQALPLDPMIQSVASIIREDPEALLCERENCPRCDAVRHHVHHPKQKAV